MNRIVAAEDSLDPGELRTGYGNVDLGDGEIFEPQFVDEREEANFLNETISDHKLTDTEKALDIMYHSMRNQMFWDGKTYSYFNCQ